jgi:hypothetical protein
MKHTSAATNSVDGHVSENGGTCQFHKIVSVGRRVCQWIAFIARQEKINDASFLEKFETLLRKQKPKESSGSQRVVEARSCHGCGQFGHIQKNCSREEEERKAEIDRRRQQERARREKEFEEIKRFEEEKRDRERRQ